MEKSQKQPPTLLKSMAERLSRFFRKDLSPSDADENKKAQDGQTNPSANQDGASHKQTSASTTMPRRRKGPRFGMADSIRSVAEMSSEEARLAIEQQVEKHLGDSEFDVVKMANQLGTSRTNLYMIMRREYGETPAGFILDRRIRHAVALLDTGSTVREACFKCGFSDPKYFSKVFRKYYGMLPSQYIESKK